MGIAFDQDLQVSGLYRHALIQQLLDGTLYVSLPEQLFWQPRSDTISYTCGEKEYLSDIVAGHYGSTYAEPWFVIEIVAQFQPVPIIDPSVPLPTSYELQLPSQEYIETIALGDSLTDVPEL